MTLQKSKKTPAVPVAKIVPLANRLLELLAGEGAYGWEGEENGCDRIIIASPRRGVSVRVGSFSLADADALRADDLARWEVGASSGRRRLEITPEGRARLARRSAPHGAEPFLAQHVPLSREKHRDGGGNDSHLVDDGESPIAWLATRKGTDGKPLIDPASLQAGDRLRRDLTFAQMMPRVTADWTAGNGGGGFATDRMGYSDLAISARQRVNAAIDFVGGDFAGLLIDVCGFLKGLETVERERGWPRRSAKLVLTLALRQLARHYGIETEATGPKRSLGLRQWGADDFRPSISPKTADD